MKIICIGRNYFDHAKELGNKVPEEPVFFMKPETAIIQKNMPFFYPDFSSNIHYEAELVIKICKLGKHISERYAHTYYNEISVGIDFTARDMQDNCKKNGLPWEIAKAFDGSAAIGKFVNKKNIDDIADINFHLNLNDTIVQQGNSAQMLFNFDQLISYISKFITLKIGDLIFTGTPAGVGKLKTDDWLEAYMQDKKLLEVKIK